MAKGRFNITGTKDFLVAGIVCVFFCLWAVHDAWFPGAVWLPGLVSKSVLEKHPQRIEAAFEVPGTIQSVAVETGDEIDREMVLATLYPHRYQEAVDAAEAAFTEAREAKSSDAEDKLNLALRARNELKACTMENQNIAMKDSHGEDSFLRGKVLEVLKHPSDTVEVMTADVAGKVVDISEGKIFVLPDGQDEVKEYDLKGMAPLVHDEDAVEKGSALAGTPVLAIDPKDGFYIFNKTLAVFSFLGAIFSFIFHGIASR